MQILARGAKRRYVILEKSVENRVVKWAKKNKVLVRKMNGAGFAGWPDRLFVFTGGLLWIEFKRPGEQLRKLQVEVIRMLRERGQDVEVHDSSEEAIEALKERLEAARISEKSR